MDPKRVDAAEALGPELYQIASQHWAHAEQIRWTLLYNYLMASTILLLAWATVYGANPAFRSRPWILGLLSAAGAMVSLAWVALGLRASSFVDAYAETGKLLEERLGQGNDLPFAQGAKRRREITGWPSRVTSRLIVAAVPSLFASVYLVLSGLAVKWILGR